MSLSFLRKSNRNTIIILTKKSQNELEFLVPTNCEIIPPGLHPMFNVGTKKDIICTYVGLLPKPRSNKIALKLSFLMFKKLCTSKVSKK